MHDLGERMRLAAGEVSPPEPSFERLLRRRDRRRRRERMMAGAVAIALVAGVLGGTLAVLSRTGRHRSVSPAGQTSGSSGKLGSKALLGDGQYLYMRRAIVT